MLLRLEFGVTANVLAFAHLRYVDGDDTVHEQLVEGVFDYNLGELHPLDGVAYGIVEIYAHAFARDGTEADLEDPRGCALAVMVTLLRVEHATTSDPCASMPTS